MKHPINSAQLPITHLSIIKTHELLEPEITTFKQSKPIQSLCYQTSIFNRNFLISNLECIRLKKLKQNIGRSLQQEYRLF
jgi:hypothetical protein